MTSIVKVTLLKNLKIVFFNLFNIHYVTNAEIFIEVIINGASGKIGR
jgi:hypothetical protein